MHHVVTRVELSHPRVVDPVCGPADSQKKAMERIRGGDSLTPYPSADGIGGYSHYVRQLILSHPRLDNYHFQSCAVKFWFHAHSLAISTPNVKIAILAGMKSTFGVDIQFRSMYDSGMEILADIERVHLHPDNVEIRGANPSLTDMRDSVQQDGQAYALSAIIGDDGDYYVYDGGRRLAALTAAGVTHVRLSVEELTRAQVLRRIAASSIKAPFPHVVVRDGCVVGGKAWLVQQMLSQGLRRDEIATSMGERVDVVSAYQSLLSEDEEILIAVSDGRLEITAYARIKYKPPEFKRQLIDGAKGKKVPARAVIKAIQEDNASVVGEMVRERPSPETVNVEILDVLLRVRAGLMTLRNSDVDITKFEIWDDIVDLWEEVNDGLG